MADIFNSLIVLLVAILAGIGFSLGFLGIFSYFFLVPIYTQYFKRADCRLWQSVGSPFIGASPMDAHIIYGFLFKRKYLKSCNKKFVIFSSLMRWFYALSVVIGPALVFLAMAMMAVFPKLFP